jgi:hypothetical protein
MLAGQEAVLGSGWPTTAYLRDSPRLAALVYTHPLLCAGLTPRVSGPGLMLPGLSQR